MQIFSYHLVNTPSANTVKTFFHPPTRKNTPGLINAECMAAMTLGAPIFSSERILLNQLAVFASWENENALDEFLENCDLGRHLSTGWHVRMTFLRRWGHFPAFGDLPEISGDNDPSQPVVAVTLARLKLPQVFRFIRWGRPVEELVRDHPGKTLALAAFRPWQTFNTFSIWRTQKEMTDMVHGHDSPSGAGCHADAMKERDRKDFHYHFTTLRFRAIAEYGQWKGQSKFLPDNLIGQDIP